MSNFTAHLNESPVAARYVLCACKTVWALPTPSMPRQCHNLDGDKVGEPQNPV
ncbi:hypothetical protein M404DRAFT_1001162 [Pisolithus tinctorius Marx 270]|uniref:Uncharacterized protein n=1 Tax=Pisolithus tinctorius Marx 270 TaxID=870435 RepID=A0A0C3J3L7_PISTI|nr:hypothetical protein M404DRAFT_1001162 [Pisolithus tinctorius Marx 270]